MLLNARRQGYANFHLSITLRKKAITAECSQMRRVRLSSQKHLDLNATANR